jgi:hypothetical protein
MKKYELFFCRAPGMMYLDATSWMMQLDQARRRRPSWNFPKTQRYCEESFSPNVLTMPPR